MESWLVFLVVVACLPVIFVVISFIRGDLYVIQLLHDSLVDAVSLAWLRPLYKRVVASFKTLYRWLARCCGGG